MAAGATSEDAERRRDKLSLRIRKEGKFSSELQRVPKNVENDQLTSHELPPVSLVTTPCHKSRDKGDNR